MTPTIIVTRQTPGGLIVHEMRYDLDKAGPRYVAGPLNGHHWLGFDDRDGDASWESTLTFETEAEAVGWLAELLHADDEGPETGVDCGCDGRSHLLGEVSGERGLCGPDGRPAEEN